LVNGDYTWLAIVLVVASMISLGYYLRVVATMWMAGPATAPAPYAPIAGGSQEADSASDGGQAAADDGGQAAADDGGQAAADDGGQAAADDGGHAAFPLGRATSIPLPEVAFVALLFAAASIFFGIFPSPLFDLVNHAGSALSGLVP
jgi:NADH-quinone oxidoreductase subunit N